MSPVTTLVRSRMAKWPLLVVAAMSSVALVAAIAWITFGYRTDDVRLGVVVAAEPVVATKNTPAAAAAVVVTEMDLQSGKYPPTNNS